MEGGGFVSEGGYGCTYYPEISCSGKETSNKNFLSKIQLNDDSAKNEIKISKLLKKALNPNELNEHFAPVISSCQIDLNELEIDEMDKCSHIKKAEGSDFILMKIKYIDGRLLDKFFIEESNSTFILRIFIHSFKHLLKSIQLLNKAKIVHNDLKNSNILFDEKKLSPLIIDFGLSIPIEQINSENIKYYFYIYAPDYYMWPLEIHILNYYLHINEDFSLEELKNIVDSYVDGFQILKAFSPQFKEKYRKLCLEVAKKYLNLPKKIFFKKILTKWNSWDSYALSVEFIKLTYILLNVSENQIITNNFSEFIVTFLIYGIHPDPKERFSIEKMIELFNQFLLEQETENIEEISDLILKNKKTISKKLKDSVKLSKKMSKRISRRKVKM
tara:strand:+ start:2559 stop:3719 length:1161 start_codon:yes stop_codon:yes gene_type:complete